MGRVSPWLDSRVVAIIGLGSLTVATVALISKETRSWWFVAGIVLALLTIGIGSMKIGIFPVQS